MNTDYVYKIYINFTLNSCVSLAIRLLKSSTVKINASVQESQGSQPSLGINTHLQILYDTKYKMHVHRVRY